MNIQSIKAFNDNYIWLINTNEGNLVIDPGESQPVIDYMQQHQLRLTDILITHHHYDHVGGIVDLRKNIDGKVFGPNNPQIEGLDAQVTEGMTVQACGLEFQVLEIPGHTLDHIAYFLADGSQPRLFCGDTLFSVGCGRVFEGTPQQMFAALEKLNALPANTLVYCAHEYTLANLKFAQAVEPNNSYIPEHIEVCQRQRDADLPTLPSTMELERKINPFLRCSEIGLRQSLESKIQDAKTMSDVEIFKYLRAWKDSF
jgi:hydroxyacylglutathione hydrolase